MSLRPWSSRVCEAAAAIEYAENTSTTCSYISFGRIIFVPDRSLGAKELAEERGTTVARFTGLTASGHGDASFTEIADRTNAAAATG